jgi:predicted nucleotidyltransferase
MVEAIVEAVNVEKIVLFGSRARGTASSESDVDLLIVVSEINGHSRWQQLSKARHALLSYLIAIDLVLYGKDELTRFTKLRGHVVTTALTEGRVLYERQRER